MSTGTTTSNSASPIPVIDLSPWTVVTEDDNDSDKQKNRTARRQAVVEAVAAACRDVGFLAVTGHGVPDDVVQAALEASKAFFDLPDAVKQSFKTDDPVAYPYGYENCEVLARGKARDSKNQNTATTATADLKETFSMGPSHAGAPPRRVPDVLEPALTAYYTAMERLAAMLLEIFAAAWQLPLDWFAQRCTTHASALRILNYPTVDMVNSSGTMPLRASAHTDYGPLTILYSGGPGLQVQKDAVVDHDSFVADDESQNWIDVPDIPGGFIINLGDLMQRWTNDKWRSTLHRVVVKTPGIRRQSMAYFCNMNADCLVDPRDLMSNDKEQLSHYPPTTAMEHLMTKHLASMGHSDISKQDKKKE